MKSQKVANGVFWVEIPEADLRILCGCPADSVKHLIKLGLIAPASRAGVSFETGPNAILISDTPLQKGSFANLAEFPFLQMFYRQGMIIPGHPGNTGHKPLLIGLGDQVRAQAEYVMRGNYGLLSAEEIEACGVPRDAAAEMMAVKKRFAFGRIQATDELVDMKALDGQAVEIVPGVVVHRKGFNLYEFLAGGGSLEVDLNLGPGEEFQPSYTLPTRGIRREQFSVIHTGEGDGWDFNRPCTGSIVCSAGEFYVVDAGPFVTHSLEALGLSVPDITGIFHTHAHDDHFAGLTSLVRSERRLKYYAVPMVRMSVQKKLAALMNIDDEQFSRYFDVHDLRPGEWNRVGDMEVRPVYSPHPVETTVFFFRSGKRAARRTYAHLTDLSSFSVLHNLAVEGKDGAALSRRSHDQLIEKLLEPVDVKKVDAGGGSIHGDALDFSSDSSRRLLLSHGIPSVPPELAERGAIAGFAEVDVLISDGSVEHLRRVASASLKAWFPGVSRALIQELARCPVVEVAAGTEILPSDNPGARLILSGIAESGSSADGSLRRLTAGSFTTTVQEGDVAEAPCRAVGNVSFLAIPRALLRTFLSRNRALELLADARSLQDFLARSPLFAGIQSQNVLNTVAAGMQKRTLREGQHVAPSKKPELLLLADGQVDLVTGPRLVESIGTGGHWGEEQIVSAAPGFCEARAASDCVYFAVPADSLANIPLVQWGLLESFYRRMRSFRTGYRFEWFPFFSVGVGSLDDEHKRLFRIMDELSALMETSGSIAGHQTLKQKLLDFTRTHFENEEALMEIHGYSRLPTQRKDHAELLSKLERIVNAVERRSRPRPGTVTDFLKDWLLLHILIEDLQYRDIFQNAGLR
jgi:hemerythrin